MTPPRKSGAASGAEPAPGPDRETCARAAIDAIEAARLPVVANFRNERLGNVLMKLEDVERWIKDRAAEDGPPSPVLRIQLRAGVQPSPTDLLRQLPDLVREALSAEIEWILLACPPTQRRPRGDPERRVVYGPLVRPVRADGVLGNLKEVAQLLVNEYKWTEPHAVAFVLTGLHPVSLTKEIKVSCEYPSPFDPPGRIHLEVSPQTTEAKMLAAFRDARERPYRAERQGPRRARSLEDKHVKMAVFLAETAGLTKAERMEAWNKSRPDFPPYRNEERFDREARQAYRHLTGRIWTSPRPRAFRLKVRTRSIT